MFHYKFQANHLISAIVLSDRRFTIYLNKESSWELDYIFEKHQFKIFYRCFSNEPLHELFHDRSLNYDQEVHQHWTIEASVDKKKAIEGFFNDVVLHQNSPSERLGDKQRLAEKFKNHDTRQLLANYDLKGLFIDENEKVAFIQALNQYFLTHENQSASSNNLFFAFSATKNHSNGLPAHVHDDQRPPTPSHI